MLQVGTWKDRPKNPMFGYSGKSQVKPGLTHALASVFHIYFHHNKR